MDQLQQLWSQSEHMASDIVMGLPRHVSVNGAFTLL